MNTVMTIRPNLPFTEAGTHVAPRQAGVAAYREAIAPVFDLNMDAGQDETDLWVKSYHVGPLLLGRAHMAGSHFRYRRDGGKIAATALDLILVQIVMAGSDVRYTGRFGLTTGTFDVCLLDLARPFRSETADCTNFTLAIPRGLLGISESRIDDLHGLTLRGQTPAAALMAAHVDHVWQLAGHMTADDAPAIARGTIDLLTALAAPHVDTETRVSSVAEAVIIRLKRHIDQNLGVPDLGPDHLCRHFGLSRARLYRLFAPFGGVADYIRRRRLHRAMTILSDPKAADRPLGALAVDLGFGDGAAFSRAFKTQFDMTPSEARELGRDTVWQRGEDETASPLPLWLRMLDAA